MSGAARGVVRGVVLAWAFTNTHCTASQAPDELDELAAETRDAEATRTAAEAGVADAGAQNQEREDASARDASLSEPTSELDGGAEPRVNALSGWREPPLT